MNKWKKIKHVIRIMCAFILLVTVLALSDLLLTADQNRYKVQTERIERQTEEMASLQEEGKADTGADDPEKTKESESTKEAIKDDHDLRGNMWRYYKDEEVSFVDEATFEIIWEAYKEVDYSIECEKGDLEVYEEYKQKFWQLINNEIPFWDRETGKEIYIKDWTDSRGVAKIQHIETNEYYFFDVNGDNLPELGIFGGSTTVFAYDADKDRMILWTWIGREIIGTRTAGYYPEFVTEIFDFFRFDSDGDIEFEILVWAEHEDLYHYDINMVMFPAYADPEKRWEITEEMKQQGIYEESSGQWFFRVTDEQYEKLEEPLVSLLTLAYRRMRDSTYTYEGLFGEFETE